MRRPRPGPRRCAQRILAGDGIYQPRTKSFRRSSDSRTDSGWCAAARWQEKLVELARPECRGRRRRWLPRSGPRRKSRHARVEAEMLGRHPQVEQSRPTTDQQRSPAASATCSGGRGSAYSSIRGVHPEPPRLAVMDRRRRHRRLEKLAPDGLVEEHALTLPCHMGAHGRPSASQPVPPHSKPAPKVRIAAGPKVPTVRGHPPGPWASTAPTMGAWLRPQTPRPDFTAVVELARLAPSVHEHPAVALPRRGRCAHLERRPGQEAAALDPDARQQTISCGAALLSPSRAAAARL